MEGMQVRGGISDDGMRYLTTASGSTLSEDDLPGGEFEQLWNARNDPRNASALAQHIDQVADEAQWSAGEIGMAGAAGLGAAAMMPGIGPAVRGGVKAAAGMGGKFAKGVYNQGASVAKEAWDTASPALRNAGEAVSNKMGQLGNRLQEADLASRAGKQTSNGAIPAPGFRNTLGESMNKGGEKLGNFVAPATAPAPGRVTQVRELDAALQELTKSNPELASAAGRAAANPTDQDAIFKLLDFLSTNNSPAANKLLTSLPADVLSAIDAAAGLSRSDAMKRAAAATAAA